MEDFEPLTHNPFRGDVSVSLSRTASDDFSPVSQYPSLESYDLLTQLRHKDRTVSPDGDKGERGGERRTRTFWPHPTWISWIPPFAKVGCPYLEKMQISLSPKTYPRCKQAPSSHFPYAYPVQDCRGLCCSWLCDAGRAKENRQKTIWDNT